MNLSHCLIVLILKTFATATAPSIDVVFIIQSQDTKYHSDLNHHLKENIIQQSMVLQPQYRIKVYVLHEIFNYPGGWTIHNLIPQLMFIRRKAHKNTKQEISSHSYTNKNKQIDINVINDNTRWIVFCEERTKVKVKLLLDKLKDENHTQPFYLGYPLYDREATIVHHFAFWKNPKWFPYPMLSAGVVFSMPLFKSIADIYANLSNNKHLKQQSSIFHRSEFSIDASHELARFIYDNVQIPAVAKTSILLQNDNVKYSTKAKTDFLSTTSNDIIDKHKGDISNLRNSNTTTITNTSTKNHKIMLKKASYICPMAMGRTSNSNKNKHKNNYEDKDDACAMYAERITNAPSSMTCFPVKREEIYFAVKTCSKYHKERIPIIQATWASYAKHVKYFSDFEDNTIPTINTGIPNVEMGHCAKTLKILKLALRDIENYNNQQQRLHHANQAKHVNHQIQWLFLTDDDTLLSVSGVCQVLGCYNSIEEIYLGERYGYRLYAEDGFNYITGGGGIAFSLPVVKLILQQCSCPSPSSPDDMILGSCLHSLQVKPLHSSRFHQARPNDYPIELLKQESPVSFHKFWQLDPVYVYKQWFAGQDRQLFAEEYPVYGNLIDLDFSSKTRKLLAKTDTLHLHEMPVFVGATLHDSKQRHIDL